MNSSITGLNKIVSLERKIVPLKKGDFIYLHPRDFVMPAYLGRFCEYGNEGENLYEVNLNVDVKFKYSRGFWLPERIMRNRRVIEKVDVLGEVEEDGYTPYVGKKEIFRGMKKHRNFSINLAENIMKV